MTRPLQPFSYRQEVKLGGYEWVCLADARGAEPTEKNKKIFVLVPRTPNSDTRVYDPFEDEPGMFRDFALCGSNKDSVLAFVNKYGPFSWKDTNTYSSNDIHGWYECGLREDDSFDETFDRWSWRSTVMDVALRPLDALERSLSAGVDDERKRSVENILLPEMVTLFCRMNSFAQFRIEISDCRPPGSFFGPEYALRLHPSSLIEVMWLQYAQVITGQKVLRPCVVCGKPFDVGPGQWASKETKEYCSEACRSKADRQRKRAFERLALHICCEHRDAGAKKPCAKCRREFRSKEGRPAHSLDRCPEGFMVVKVITDDRAQFSRVGSDEVTEV